jgi:hypothetical protein
VHRRRRPLRRAARRCAAAALAFCAGAAAGPLDNYSVALDPGGRYAVSAAFRNYNADALALEFKLDRFAVEQSMSEFGYAEADLRDIASDCAAHEDCDQAEYDGLVGAYFKNRAIDREIDARGVAHLTVDIPAEVARNRPRLAAAAAALERMADARHYGAEQTFGAALALVQTALVYRQPPARENGRELLGFHPPPRALAIGAGDCDTKSALLAALMTNFSGVRMIGIHVPGHYLVGIGRVPRAGDAAIEFRGEPYVLVEPAGPARLPPGTIADSTQAALAVMQGVRIDPLF